MPEVQPILWKEQRLHLLDQRLLPSEETYIALEGATDTAEAIRAMVVRGAPAIGVTAAFGLAMQARAFRADRLSADLDDAVATLGQARPTAVNLTWALQRLRKAAEPGLAAGDATALADDLEREAVRMMEADVDANRRLGAHGAALLSEAGTVMTHCNAGALATAGYGTAIGVVRAAWESGISLDVVATETRPFLQGARLTAWELKQLGIPVTLVTDGMVGHVFQTGRVGAVVVGTDRTAANGDVANKIGTYTIAVLARRHGVPFYVAAPTSSIDLDCPDGAHIPIEERDADEVTHVGGCRVAAAGVNVFNPAFDVTPAELVTAIVTEEGVVSGDYDTGLRRMVEAAAARR